MATLTLLSPSRPSPLQKSKTTLLVSDPEPSMLRVDAAQRTQTLKPITVGAFRDKITMTTALLGAGFALTLAGSASALELPLSGSSLPLYEPPNALSLPTWVVHVSSVVEWATAMALVWQYGEKSGYESWKGLSWGMVPLLAGALCACTWHFFYNSEDLEVLVALQAALTVMGNATMCLAAYRIYKSSERSSKNM
ncbi:hypothetical protein NMG60_11027233 [Bertholletia excelsa]